MAHRGVLVAGTIVLDIINIIDHWPAEETLSFIERVEYAAGGSAHNAAAGLVKLGATFPVTLLSIAGDDHYGKVMLANAQSYGVDTSHVAILPGAMTAHAYVMSSAATGRRSFFAALAANNELGVEHLLPGNHDAKIYYLGSPGVARKLDATDGWRRLLGAARAKGMKTCLELNPVPAEILRRQVVPCLPLCDYFVVNDYEVESVTGITTTRQGKLDWTAAEAASRKLIAMGVTEVAGVHHPDGAVAVTAKGEVVRASSVKVEPAEIAGSTGAGDAFFAGLLFGLHEEWPLAKCMALANASAATSLHSPTTSASIRPWADCLAFAAERGLRPLLSEA